MPLTEHRFPVKRNDTYSFVGSGVIATASVVFEGALLVADQVTGLIKPAADAGAAGSSFAGICTGFKKVKTVPLTGVVGDGTAIAEFETNLEVLLPCPGSVTVADVGNAAYAYDDTIATDDSTAGPGIGVFVAGGQESTNTAWVRLGAAALPDAT
jgi:hypothetical protein